MSLLDEKAQQGVRPAPPRVRRPGAATYVLLVVLAAILIHGWTQGVLVNGTSLVTGGSRLWDFLGQVFPPDVERLPAILLSLLLTFEMAVLGTLIGAVLSLPLGILAARNTSPHRLVYAAARGLISVCRTIPDMVWGLIFVIAVGLGPEAGVLALAVDAMGFCGRFFAEAIEEVDPGPLEALRSIGAPEHAVVLGGVVPACIPSFVATAMFALESGTRSSVVLGLVGAGGIGIELSTSMALLRYDEAMTIILLIFVVVLTVERVSSRLRRRILRSHA